MRHVDSDKVEEHLKKAHELEPNDAAINAHFAVLKKMQHRDNVKSAGFFKSMFTALSNEAGATDANANTSASTTTTATVGAGESNAAATAAGGAATDVDLNEENVTVDQ
jgi:hypothetical protein